MDYMKLYEEKEHELEESLLTLNELEIDAEDTLESRVEIAKMTYYIEELQREMEILKKYSRKLEYINMVKIK